MHQIPLRCGLISFSSAPGARPRATATPYAPTPPSARPAAAGSTAFCLGWLGAGQGDQMGLRAAVEGAGIDPLGRLGEPGRFRALLDESLADPLDGAGARIQ